MTKALKFLAALLLAVPVFAQAQRIYSQPELEQMLAPLALHPDALLSQVLIAANYPHQVAVAAHWSRANPRLQGGDAVRAVQYKDWDPSVKSLVAFAQILARMAGNPDWTRSLRDAFLMQGAQLMAAVQQLRRNAQAAGKLSSSGLPQQAPDILLRPAPPQYFYVPYYRPPLVVSRTVVVTPHRWRQVQRIERPPVRVQPQIRMPAAAAPPQHPRAHHHQPHQAPRNERGHKGRQRS